MRDNRTSVSTASAVKVVGVLGLISLLIAFGPIDTFAQGTAPRRGFQPGGSYLISDVETISTGSGNLMLNFPFGTLPAGRAGMTAGLSLSYSSKLYDSHVRFEADPLGRLTASGEQPLVERNLLRPSDEGGWRYSFGYSLEIVNRLDQYQLDRQPQYPSDEARSRWKVKVKLPDGSAHELTPRGFNAHDLLHDGYYDLRPDGWRSAWSGGGCYPAQCAFVQDQPYYSGTITYYSTDGSYLRLDVRHDADGDYLNNPWVLYLPDGGRVVPSGTSQLVFDRNNNYVEIQPSVTSANGHVATRLRDQLGREVTLEYGYAQDEDAIRVKGPGGAELLYRIRWKTIAVGRRYLTSTQSDNGFPDTLGTLRVVAEIILPQQGGGLSYTFGYNAADFAGQPLTPSYGWGELSSVTLPSGAKAKYEYSRDGADDTLYWDAVLSGTPTRKELVYRAEYDAPSTASNQPCAPSGEACVTEVWHYILNPATPNIGGGGGSSVTNPDGGTTLEWLDDRGQAYRSQSPDGTVTERLWRENVPQDHPALLVPNFRPINGYIKTEFRSVRDAGNNLTKTAIKDYEHDKNGNVTQVKEYDWVAYGDVPRDAAGNPTGLPQGLSPKRVTTNEYYAETPDASDASTASDNAYYAGGLPRLRNAVESTEVGDAAGTLSRTEFHYDDPLVAGNLIEQRSWDSTRGGLARPLAAGTYVSVSRQYDQFGNVTLTTDANGNQTQLVYGAVAGPDGAATGLYPTETKAALNTSVQRRTLRQYDFYTGLTTRTTDADNDVSTATSYDPFGRPVLVKAAEGRPEETRTSTEYSDAARRVVVRADLDVAGDGKNVSVQHYDQLGRVRLSRLLEDAATQDAADEAAGIKTQTRYAYAGGSSYVLTSNPYRAATSDAAGGEATMGWTLNTSDRGGRSVRVEGFGGAALPAPFAANNQNSASTGAVVTAYDAEAVTVTDQAGRQKRSVSDALGRLVQVFEAPNAAGYNYLTSYAYDALGNLRQVAQGAQTRTFNYSSLSRLTSAQNPEGGTVAYLYDPNGNQVLKIDPRPRPGGITLPDCYIPYTGAQTATCYGYDALGRVRSRAYNDGTPPVTYGYDDAAVANSKGRITSVSSSVSTYRYTAYDALGRVTGSSQTTGDDTYTMPDNRYNLAGALVSERYPSGRVVVTGHDAAGKVAGVKNQATGLYYAGASPADADNRIRYAAQGAVSALRLGNGLWEQAAFNARLQPVRIGLGTSAVDSSKLRLTYGYGPAGENNGNVRSQRIEAGALDVTQTYDYDAVNRLLSAREAPTAGGADAWRQTYTYLNAAGQGGQFGNRRVDTSTDPAAGQPRTTANATPLYNPTVNQANNRFDDDQGYAYDVAGNLRQDPAHTYSYDADNRVAAVDGGWDGVHGASYYYDGEGRRVKKVTAAETTVFIYDAQGRLVAEYSNRFEYKGTRYLTQDHLGSTRVVTDAQGNAHSENGAGGSRRDYMPFGEEISAGVGGRTQGQGYAQPDGLRQKWAKLQRDDETGLDYARNRYYSSAQGRFTSTDPVKLTPARQLDPQQLNLYAYARNNSLKFIDPEGEDIFLANDTNEGRRKALLNITRNMTAAEQKNVGYRKTADGKYEVYIKDPSKVNLGKASQGYSDLADRVGNHDLRLNFTFIEKGKSAKIEINGVLTAVTQKALSGASGGDAGGFVSPQADGSFAVVAAEGGYTPGVKGLTKSGRDTTVAMPDYLLTAHELFAETYKYTPAGIKEGLQNSIIDDSNKVIEIENKYREFHGLPKRSGKDHGYLQEEVTVRP